MTEPEPTEKKPEEKPEDQPKAETPTPSQEPKKEPEKPVPVKPPASKFAPKPQARRRAIEYFQHDPYADPKAVKDALKKEGLDLSTTVLYDIRKRFQEAHQKVSPQKTPTPTVSGKPKFSFEGQPVLTTPELAKPLKPFDKEKIRRVIDALVKGINWMLIKVSGDPEEISDADTQRVSDAWYDVAEAYRLDAPRIILVITAIVVTVAVYFKKMKAIFTKIRNFVTRTEEEKPKEPEKDEAEKNAVQQKTKEKEVEKVAPNQTWVSKR